jgi:hypothetical protein
VHGVASSPGYHMDVLAGNNNYAGQQSPIS